MNNHYRAVILDRDGTLNRTTQILRAGQQAGDPTDGYVLAPHELALLPKVPEALAALRHKGLRLFVFTQQNCIGKGLATTADIDAIHRHMNNLLPADARIEAFFVAYSTPGQPDSPRAKPSPAMINEILEYTGLTAQEVLVVGDSLRDCAAARAAGCDFAWVRDDLGRVSAADMTASGYPVYDSVFALAENIAPHCAPHKMPP